MNLNVIPFDCDRTCPQHEQAVNGLYLCRFNPVLKVLRIMAHSHTATMKVDYGDIDALKAAVLAIGGVWYGPGNFDLFDSKQTGHGFRLRMSSGQGWSAELGKDGRSRERAKAGEAAYWLHPIVLRPDGQLAYDEYGGAWGDVTQLARLKAEYIEQSAFVKVEKQAQLLGWQTERQEGKLLVYCPAGGTLTVTSGGEISTAGFSGGGCHQAREQLGIQVDPNTVVHTAEACEVPAMIHQEE